VPGNTGLYTKAKSFSELLGLARRKQAKEDQGSKRGFALVALEHIPKFRNGTG
jgi:hypothetical protein